MISQEEILDHIRIGYIKLHNDVIDLMNKQQQQPKSEQTGSIKKILFLSDGIHLSNGVHIVYVINKMNYSERHNYIKKEELDKLDFENEIKFIDFENGDNNHFNLISRIILYLVSRGYQIPSDSTILSEFRMIKK